MKLLFATLALLVVIGASAREVTADLVMAPQATDEPPAPRIGVIMQQQQMRHIKLWFAGRGGNWPLADYEIDQLKDGFDDLNQQIGGDTVEKAVGAPIAAIEKAIDAKDRSAFINAFDKLTAGCNSCHRTLDHGFIVIQRPTSPPYSNQVFAPRR
jgi:hypothetical protein